MDDQNKNLILATALSFLVILVWFVLFPPQDAVVDPNAPAIATENASAPVAADDAPTSTAENTANATTVAPAESPRVQIDTPRLSGSISLLGGRIDPSKNSTVKTRTMVPPTDLNCQIDVFPL